MPGVEFQRFRQGQNLPLQTVVEFGGAFFHPAGKIRSPYRTHKEGVACEKKPGLGTPGLIRYEEADALRCVPWSVQDFDADITQVQLLFVSQRGKTPLN